MKKSIIFVLGILLLSAAAYAAPVWTSDPIGVATDEDATDSSTVLSTKIDSGCDLGCTYSIKSTTSGINANVINGDELEIVPNSDYHGTGTVTITAEDGSGTADKDVDVKVLSIPDLGSDITVDTSYFDGSGTTDLSTAGDDISEYQGESDPDHAYQNSVYFFSLERDLIGKVTFEGNFPFIWDLALAYSNVRIENGFISVDSDSILNKMSYWINHPTAKVELYNVDPSGYITDGSGVPIVYKDTDFHLASDPRDSWPECGNDCDPVNWNEETGTLTFYVDQFSSFALNDDDGSGNGGNGSVPEFSSMGMVLAVLIAIIGIALIVKKKR